MGLKKFVVVYHSKWVVPHRNITMRNGWMWGVTDWERRHLGGGMVGRAILGEPPAPTGTTRCQRVHSSTQKE